ncbi:pentapeptide repeat-containing protein [Actinokineospora sp. PR83]|uniref:pentapeptide repeat-containing protein n=1 Tax=Actinokineospora sp. PR83 TaxID=2884908 RepID=UPI0027E087E4|nr:pentapeptide repeat-containing protein [Actinokineospora sp. PR83]MCG8918257.1 pentapeptide repeat-containing protein [Actinokineospora sp. PR83]
MSRRRGGASWWRPVLVVVLPVLVSAAAAVMLLFDRLAPSTPADRLDTVRTGLAVAAGIGALITLALALRRQQSTEHDATERRLTELYVKAVDQIGSDKPAVRHGGLYALERVAQDNPEHRQTIIDVICAYLRGPYTPPSAPGTRKLNGLRAPLRPAHARPTTPPDTATAADTTDQDARQEREVRLTAQRILRDHLQRRTRDRTWYRWFPRPHRTFWPDIDLDLTNATLINIDLTNTTIRTARFDGARFSGDARFDGAQFNGDARFDGAQFNGNARFDGAQFNGNAWFSGAQFNGITRFYEVQFSGLTRFAGVQFGGAALFGGAQFSGEAWFGGAWFSGDARFYEAQFSGNVLFGGAWFSGDARFDGAQFSGNVLFDRTQFSGDTGFKGTRFSGGIPKEIRPYLRSNHDAPVDPDPDN